MSLSGKKEREPEDKFKENEEVSKRKSAEFTKRRTQGRNIAWRKI